MDSRVLNFLTVAITLIWVGSVVIGWLDHTYAIPYTVQSVMFLLAGYCYGRQLVGGYGKKDNDDKDPNR